ncbi:MAG: DUF2093 domain-containing protein [Rhizobiaceae bacterium]
MLNRPNTTNSQIANVRYLESDFQVLAPGANVVCAITGKSIPLDELKYWSWERQEAYIDAQASLEAEQRAGRLS